jgi:Protein of unknown function (DUF2934)
VPKPAGSKGSKRQSNTNKSVGEAIPVDPNENRAPNAHETAPETLVPDVVRTHLTSSPADEPPEQRERRIADRAYAIARERGFAPGAELDDWLQAEREVDEQWREQSPPEDQFTG